MEILMLWCFLALVPLLQWHMIAVEKGCVVIVCKMENSSEYSVVCIKQCVTVEFFTAEGILLIEIHHQM